MVGPHSLEMVMHVAELADTAWSVRERHLEHVAMEKQEEEVEISTVEALAKERLENQKLRAALQEYENALQKELERQGSTQTLEASLHVSQENSPDLYKQLKEKLETPSFLDKLKGLPSADSEASSAVKNYEDGVNLNSDDEDPNWFLLVDDNTFFGSEVKEEEEGLDSEGYVYVTQEDFVDGIANFLAKYVSLIPQAKQMSPHDLQKTILRAFNQSEKPGKVRKLWETAKMLYTATSWGATVFGLYRHPLVLRAASTAVLTTCSLILALIK